MKDNHKKFLLTAALGVIAFSGVENYRLNSVHATTSDCCTVGTDCSGHLLCCNNVASKCDSVKSNWCKMSC